MPGPDQWNDYMTLRKLNSEAGYAINCLEDLGLRRIAHRLRFWKWYYFAERYIH